MGELDIFSEDESALLARTLYKVGVWISYAEDEEGEEDDVREMKALESCIAAVAKKYDGPGLVDDIAREVFVRRSQWDEWADGCFNALDDVKTAINVMRAHGSETDQKRFKAALVEVAQTVAMAYGEFGEFDDEDEKSGFGALLGKITGGFAKLTADDKDHPMNISAAEGSAIEELKMLLREG